MKRITKMTLFVLALASLAGLVVFAVPAVMKAQDPNAVTFDVACDCRTFAPASPPDRSGVFIVNGKIFPAGTLPTGPASNDPTLPVNGVNPIGNWICRGQAATPFPPAIASAYSSAPTVLNTQYYILNDGRALTLEGYDLASGAAALSVTGGIGGFSGAVGDIQFPGAPMGTNATGCPNFRAKFRIQPGSVRGASNSN